MTTKNNKQSQKGETKKWQAHFAAQARSGLSRPEYCRRQQISYHAFGYWRRKLSKTAGNNVALVPITLQAEPSRLIDFGGAADLTLVLPGSMSIAVGDNFSGATLTRLLNVLAAR
ncbi:MAG: hypothetical protein Q8M67_03560 [Bacteroidota bacterium]|nr:hypothetical protein [Bacteroidota bacterium]